MDNFGLVDALRTYCEEKGYAFYYGQDSYVNIETDLVGYSVDQKLLIADFNLIPTYAGAKITELRYTGTVLFGQKFEAETESNLDETPIQKFDRRLKTLSTLLTTVLTDIACENELDVINVNIRYDLNKFDLNADFVAASLTFVQW